MIVRLADWSYRHRRLVLAGWILLVIGTSMFMNSAEYSRDFQTPGDSQRAHDLLAERFPAGEAGDAVTVVFHADGGVESAEVRDRVGTLLREADALPHVEGSSSPYDPAGSHQIAPTGDTAYATLRLDVSGFDVPADLIADLERLAAAARTDQLDVQLGGQPVRNAESDPGGIAEMVGFLAAGVILVVAFGSIVAAGLPLLTAMLGIGLGVALVAILTHVFDIPEFAPQIAGMIGIGVGIDYALFIVTRYRDALAAGQEPQEAVRTSLGTAGRAVIIAGSTVVVSLLGLLTVGDEALRGLGIAAGLAVLATMFASVTLLPAVLGFTGRKIDALSWRRRRNRRHRAPDETLSYRWVVRVQRHPVIWAVASAAILVALAVPALSLRLGTIDAGNGRTDASSRKAYELLADGFGPGFNGPLLVVVDLRGVPGGAGDGAGRATLDNLQQRLTATAGVAQVAEPRVNEAQDTAVLSVFAQSAPQDVATDELLQRIRTDAVPAAVGSSPARVYVGGLVAGNADGAERIRDRLPWLLTIVIGLSLVLLTLTFRSLVLPLKAAAMNLLSIGAAYGAVVAVFQWGWGLELFGLSRGGPIESVLPLLMFAIAFGLSMDYEVFLLSRIREEWLRTGDNTRAVALGVGATGGIITAAAAIMISVFFAFMLGSDRLIKLFGFALAVPILLDVVLIRLILVPAMMQLFGRLNWYLPSFLDKRLPRLPVDGGAEAQSGTAREGSPVLTGAVPDGAALAGRSGKEDG